MQWLSKRPLDGPFAKTSAQPLPADAYSLCPLRQDESFAPERQPPIVPLVPVLLDGCGPAAILLGVTAGVVDAVERVSSRGARPHVGEEGLEAVAPLLGHGDPAPAVVREPGIIWVSAPANNGAPRFVFAGSGHAMVGRADLDQASAGLGSPTVQLILQDYRGASALAAAFPCGAISPPRRARPDHRQSMKYVARLGWYGPLSQARSSSLRGGRCGQGRSGVSALDRPVYFTTRRAA